MTGTPGTHLMPPDPLTERLLALRTVLISGRLSNEQATRTAAMLLSLDAESADPVIVRLHSPGGDLASALMLADTLDLMRAPVELACVGEVAGAALAVLAAADARASAPGTRFHLVEPRLDLPGPPEGPGGPPLRGGRPATELARLAEAHEAQVHRLATRIAQAANRRIEDVRADLAPPGRLLDAEQAQEYGLVGAIAGAAP